VANLAIGRGLAAPRIEIDVAAVSVSLAAARAA
jgi:hypothetical protein